VHHQTKEERRKEIEAKLRATYDAYQGSKALEFERRLQAALDDVEQGQELNAEIISKLEQRKEAAAAMVKRKGEDVQEANSIIDVRRQTAFEILDNRKYNSLSKVLATDQRLAKQLRQEEKKLAAKSKRMGEQWSEKLATVNTNVKALHLETREKDDQYFEDWATKEKHMHEIQKERAFMVQTTAERTKMHEADAKENQKRIDTLKSIRAYKILEKHALKDKVITDYQSE
jgi:hypothetical protein